MMLLWGVRARRVLDRIADLEAATRQLPAVIHTVTKEYAAAVGPLIEGDSWLGLKPATLLYRIRELETEIGLLKAHLHVTRCDLPPQAAQPKFCAAGKSRKK